MRKEYESVPVTIADVQRMNDVMYNQSIPQEYRSAVVDTIARDAASHDAYPKTLKPEERKKAAENIKAELKGKTGQERAEKRAELMDPGPTDDDAAELKHDFKKGQMVRENRQGSKPERVLEIRGNSLYTERGGTLHVSKAVHHDDWPKKAWPPKNPMQPSKSESAHLERAKMLQGPLTKSQTEYAAGEEKRISHGQRERGSEKQATQKLARTHTLLRHPQNDDDYEKKERAAIQGESKSKGSTEFNFGANKKKPNATPSKLPGWKTKTPKNYESEERKAIQGETKSKESVSFP